MNYIRTTLHHHLRQKETGFILVLVIGVSLVLTVIATSILSIQTAKYTKTTEDIQNTRTIYVAEAGISATISQLQLNTSFTGFSSKQLFYDTSDQGKAEYTTVATDNGDSTYTITSTGYLSRTSSDTSPILTKTIKVLVTTSQQAVSENTVSGPGGIIISANYNPSGSNAGSSTIASVYSRGKVWLGGGGTTLGSVTTPITLNAANIGCGDATTFPVACASNDPPIAFGGSRFNSGNGTIYGSVCATNQPASANIVAGNGGTGLQSGCIAPDYGMPTFDKAAFTSKQTVTTTVDSPACNSSWPDGAIIRGDAKLMRANYGDVCKIIISGDVYIKGNFRLSGYALQVADSLGTRSPTIVVNGNVLIGDPGDGGGIGGGAVLANSSGTPLNIISFGSSDLSATGCSMSDTCNTTTSAILYNSTDPMRSTSWATSGNWSSSPKPGITINNSAFSPLKDISGLVAYSYFGVTRYYISGNLSVAGLGGQGVIINPTGWLTGSGSPVITGTSPFSSFLSRNVYTIRNYIPVYD